jgi:hypothetical protein
VLYALYGIVIAIVLINLVRTMRTLGWQGVLHSQSLQRALTSATSYDEYLHAAAQLAASGLPAGAAPPAPPAPTALEAQLLCARRASRASPEALKRVLHRAVQGLSQVHAGLLVWGQALN